MQLIVIISLILLTATGCDKLPGQKESPYQLMTTRDGDIYRLNKQTGQVAIIQGDKIIPLKASLARKKEKMEPAAAKEENPAENSKTETESLSEAVSKLEDVTPMPEDIKAWSEKQLQGKNLKVRFKSAWKDGVMQYQLEAYPYLSLKKMLDKKEDDVYYQRKWHGFVVKLLDDTDTVIKIIPIKLWDMARNLDNKGKFSSMVIKSEIELPEDIYIRVTGYDLDWKLDRLLIPDYKFQNKVNDLMQTYSWYGEVDPKVDAEAPEGAKYWWIKLPDKKKVYFSNEEELLQSYKRTVEEILDSHKE